MAFIDKFRNKISAIQQDGGIGPSNSVTPKPNSSNSNFQKTADRALNFKSTNEEKVEIRDFVGDGDSIDYLNRAIRYKQKPTIYDLYPRFISQSDPHLLSNDMYNNGQDYYDYQNQNNNYIQNDQNSNNYQQNYQYQNYDLQNGQYQNYDAQNNQNYDSYYTDPSQQYNQYNNMNINSYYSKDDDGNSSDEVDNYLSFDQYPSEKVRKSYNTKPIKPGNNEPYPQSSHCIGNRSSSISSKPDQRRGRGGNRVQQMAFGTHVPAGDKLNKQKVDNQSLIKTPQDQLYFSKKARAIDFVPHTVEEYKKIQPTEYVQLGKLQPNLDTDEYKEKKEKLYKQLNYAKEVEMMNKLNLSKLPKKKKDPPTKEQSKRDKALEFAKHIPKPASKSKDNDENLSIQDDSNNEDIVDIELKELENKHQDLSKQVELLLKEYR